MKMRSRATRSNGNAIRKMWTASVDLSVSRYEDDDGGEDVGKTCVNRGFLAY
jgi:hypothetical protein